MVRKGKSKAANCKFETIDGVSFGWETIENSFKREEKRKKIGCAQYTHLSLKSVILSCSHDKMSVKPAKDVFSHKTINEMLTNISKRLRCCDTLLARLHDPRKTQSKESNRFVETL